MAAPVSSLVVKISGDSSHLQKELDAARRHIKTTLGSDTLKASQQALRVTKLLAAGFIGVGAASVKMAAEVQQTRTALVTLLKSTEQADKLLQEVKYFAATTPFEFKGLAKASQQMVAMGFQAEAVVPILRTVGDAVSGLGGNQETMDTVVRVLGQIQTMGKVTSKEILQLSRQGINAYQYLADAAGKSTAQIQQDLKKGSVSSAQAIEAIVLGMNKQFKGGMENQSKTLLGLWATVRENITGIMRQIGASISEGISLEKTFGEFSGWLSKFTVEIEKSGFKRAIKDMVPNSVVLTIIGLGAVLTAKLVPALIIAAKSAFTVNAALGMATGPIGIAVAAIAFLASEITGYTSVTKTAIEKTKEWWKTLGENRKILKEIGDKYGYEYIVSYGGSVDDLIKKEREKQGLSTPKNDTKQESATDRFEAALNKAMESLQNKNASYVDEKAVEKARKAYEQLQKQAESTSKAIESAWLDMTGSQRDILEAWYRDQNAELEKSKAANVNYTRDKIRLEETYQEKRRQLMNTEARERAEMLKSVTNQYEQMYSRLATMQLKGSAKGVFDIAQSARDDIKAVSDYFDELSAKYASATKEQQQYIIDALNKTGAAYKITAQNTLDFTEENLKYRVAREAQAENDITEYHRTGAAIRADIDRAYNELNMQMLQEVLTAEEAMRLGANEALLTEMETFQQAMMDAYAPISVMFANLREQFRTGLSDAITNTIMGVETLSDALKNLGKSLLKVIVDYYAKQIASRIMLGTFQKKQIAEETATSVGAAITVAAAWAPAAAAVSLASFGRNAKPAMLGISATHALSKALSVPALASGGYATGPTLALIGEGQDDEAVMPMSDWVFSRIAKEISKFMSGGDKGGVTLNNYGDINNAADEDRLLGKLFDGTRFALMGV